MLKRSLWLSREEVHVGKAVYLPSRPDTIGIIQDIKILSPHRKQVRVYFIRSKRLSKWKDIPYGICDLDAYITLIDQYYTAANLCRSQAEEGKKAFDRRFGDKTNVLQSKA